MRKQTETCSERCDVWGRRALAQTGVKTDQRDQDAEADLTAKRGSVITRVRQDGLNLLLLLRSRSKEVFSDQNEQQRQQTELCVDLQDTTQATQVVGASEERTRTR